MKQLPLTFLTVSCVAIEQNQHETHLKDSSPKCLIVSSFTYPNFSPNLYDFLLRNTKDYIFFLFFIFFHSMQVNGLKQHEDE